MFRRVLFRSNIDDGSTTVLLHDGDQMLHGQEAACQIDIADAIPVSFSRVDHTARADNTHVIVQNIDAAVLGQRGVHNSLDVIGFGDIGAQGHGLETFAVEVSGRFIGVRFVHINAGNSSASPYK